MGSLYRTPVVMRRTLVEFLSDPAPSVRCVGYRGKVIERERARVLRAEGWALLDIAEELGVAKSSVSVWCRDVDPGPRPKRRVARDRPPNVLQRRKAAEIEALLVEGRRRIGQLSERDLLIAGTALYAGEGAKRDGCVIFANSDPRMVALFMAWLRYFFTVEEHRLRFRLYLHEGLDLNAAEGFWAELTGIPSSQFTRAYRATPDPSQRTTKHEFGCASVRYSCSRTHREIVGLMDGLLFDAGILPG